MKKTLFLSIFLAFLLIPSFSFASTITPDSILQGVNQKRVSAKLSPLQRDKALDEIASKKLQDIVSYNYWSHTNPITGATPYSWFKKANYSYIYAGENLARKFKTTEGTVKGWMNSPTHKNNILKNHYSKTGIAVSQGVVVQMFSD